MRKHRILAIHRYYWPDVAPYASILRLVCESLAVNEQYEVEVFAGRSGYRGVTREQRPATEKINGVLVRRIWLFQERTMFTRLVNSTLMAIRIVWRIMLFRPSVVIASTAPPFFFSGAAAFGARIFGARFVYHCMDIHPELGECSGDIKNRGLIKMLAQLDTWVCRSASQIIVLSIAMKSNLVSKRERLDPAKVMILNNPAIPAFDDPSPEEKKVIDEFKLQTGVRIVFTGNIGRFQALDTLISAIAGMPDHSAVRLFLIGSGTSRHALETQVNANCPGKVTFMDQMSPAAVNEIIRIADAGVVSVSNGVDEFAFPSKLTNYIANACPVIAITQQDSPVARFVRIGEIGWVAEQGVQTSIMGVLKDVQNAENRPAMKERVLSYYNNNYSKESYLKEWNALVKVLLQ